MEKKWITSGRDDKYLKKFEVVKHKYLRRIEWYKVHAKDERKYAYEPSYIENLKKPGPYIKKEHLYAAVDEDRRFTLFEGMEYEIPVDYDKVLSAFYGDNWENSPYKYIDEVLANVDESTPGKKAYVYSGDEFDSTKYKHVKNVYISGRTYLSEA
ncbi:MAG: hypothetical protein Q4D29_12130 [Lachnospiraceae bacterium]|nr:hypothetical protein [Lachnospiraceae bacterium]